MSNETSPPFSGFRNARPARKMTNDQIVEADGEVARDPDGYAVEPVKRKRRTRAEIEAAQPPGVDKLAVLTQCLRALRTLPTHEDVMEALKIMTAVFK